MRLALHTALCCCVLAALLPPPARAGGAAGELDPPPEERLEARLQRRVTRDVGSAAASERPPDDRAAPRPKDNATSVSPPPSCGLLIRSRRSTSKSSGCQLVTCVYQDLIFQLQKIHQIKSCAPMKKIGPGGYGRRRRSLLDDAGLALRTRRQRRSIEDASKELTAAGIREHSSRSPRSNP